MRLVGRSEINVVIGKTLSGALVGVIFRPEMWVWREREETMMSVNHLLHDIYRVTQLGLA
jgi:hypothetical protein